MIYRYQHGVNVGSVFVLERWLGSMYEEDTNGSSELEAVKRSAPCGEFTSRLSLR